MGVAELIPVKRCLLQWVEVLVGEDMEQSERNQYPDGCRRIFLLGRQLRQGWWPVAVFGFVPLQLIERGLEMIGRDQELPAVLQLLGFAGNLACLQDQCPVTKLAFR